MLTNMITLKESLRITKNGISDSNKLSGNPFIYEAEDNVCLQWFILRVSK